MKKLLAIIGLAAATLAGAHAQVLLTNGTYSEGFNSLGNATGSTSIPSGWSISNNATTSSLGTLLTTTDRNTWADTTGGSRNVASTTGLTSSSTTTVQNAASNRALGYRQSGSIGDPGAAFVFNFNSTGLTISTISFDFLTVDPQTRTTTWLAQVSINGTAWTSLTTSPVTITDSASWGLTSVSISTVPTLVDNISSGYFRLFASVASSGSGSRDTIAIDNFSLTAVPEPSTWALIGLGSAFALWNIRRRRAING